MPAPVTFLRFSHVFCVISQESKASCTATNCKVRITVRFAQAYLDHACGASTPTCCRYAGGGIEGSTANCPTNAPTCGDYSWQPCGTTYVFFETTASQLSTNGNSLASSSSGCGSADALTGSTLTSGNCEYYKLDASNRPKFKFSAYNIAEKYTEFSRDFVYTYVASNGPQSESTFADPWVAYAIFDTYARVSACSGYTDQSTCECSRV